MRIRVDTKDEATGELVSQTLVSAGQIYIDLDPDRKSNRRGPGGGNGFLGPQLLIQLESADVHVVGIRVIPELGRDDSDFMDSVDIPKS